MIAEIEKKFGTVKISYFDENGDIKITEQKIPKYKWIKCEENDTAKSKKYLSWDNKPIKKVPTKSIPNFTLYEYLWSLPKRNQDKLFRLTDPKRSVVDIEIDWKGGKDPNCDIPITTIGFVTGNTAVVLGLKDLSAEEVIDIEKLCNNDVSKLNAKYNFKYVKFKNEYNLLHTFWFKFAPKLGVMTGWNFVDFDMKYLIKRSEKNGLDLRNASPTGETDRNGKPYHLPAVDYAGIFDKWDRSIAIKENNKLDFVSEKVLGIKKVEYDGSLSELYNTNFKKYVYYNIIDCILVKEIDKKCKTLDLLATISNLTKVELAKGSSPVNCGESLLSQEYFKQNKRIDIPDNSEKPKGKYPGAFVKNPIPGMKKGICVYDYASLYPSVMRSLNISPESYKGLVMDALQLNKYKEDDRYIVSKIKTVFEKEESALNRILTSFYNKRKENKKMATQCKNAYNILTDYIEKNY